MWVQFDKNMMMTAIGISDKRFAVRYKRTKMQRL